MAREYVIDGTRFATLEEFYDQVGSVLIPGQFWGRNLDAFNDILSWPCFEYHEPYILIWRHAALSRERLGYKELIRWLEERVEHCHPSNVQHFVERLEAAKRAEGPTLFDMLVEIIHDNREYVHLVLA